MQKALKKFLDNDLTFYKIIYSAEKQIDNYDWSAGLSLKELKRMGRGFDGRT